MFAAPVARDKKKGVIYRQPGGLPEEVRRRVERAGYGEKGSRELQLEAREE